MVRQNAERAGYFHPNITGAKWHLHSICLHAVFPQHCMHYTGLTNLTDLPF